MPAADKTKAQETITQLEQEAPHPGVIKITCSVSRRTRDFQTDLPRQGPGEDNFFLRGVSPPPPTCAWDSQTGAERNRHSQVAQGEFHPFKNAVNEEGELDFIQKASIISSFEDSGNYKNVIHL